jgi:Fanconi-associated nuclease 1
MALTPCAINSRCNDSWVPEQPSFSPHRMQGLCEFQEDLPFPSAKKIKLDDEIQQLERVSLSYLEQLEFAIHQVLEEESHLIDCDLIHSFMIQSVGAKSIFVRLFMRKWRWLRVEKLHYDELDTESKLELLRELESIGFVETDGPLALDEWFDLLVKDELGFLCSLKGISTSGKSRSQLVELLRNNDIFNQVVQTAGPVVRISENARCLIQQIIVIHQRLSEWPTNSQFMTTSILANLRTDNQNKLSFMSLNIYRTGLIWPSKEEFEDYFHALQLEYAIAELLGVNTENSFIDVVSRIERLVPKWQSCKEHLTGIPWFNVFTSGWIYTRIISTGYHAYFRLKRYGDCVQLLEQLLSQTLFLKTKRGYWYDELAKILHCYVDKSRSKQVCLEALSDSFVVTHHRASIINRLKRLCKNQSLPVALRGLGDDEPFPSRTITGTRVQSKQNRVIMKGEAGEVSVEQFALEYFSRENWNGLHTENSTVTTMFGLLFWDILFDDTIPGVFHSPFQTRPLDLYTEFFYFARKDKIEKRLLEIEQGKAIEIIEAISLAYRSSNTCGYGVNWKRFTDLQIIQIAECMGGTVLARICECFARSVWAHTGGVPDLCLWKSETKEFKLAEVKSEKDRLSQSQMEWMKLLRSWGVHVEVVHVQYGFEANV